MLAVQVFLLICNFDICNGDSNIQYCAILEFRQWNGASLQRVTHLYNFNYKYDTLS